MRVALVAILICAAGKASAGNDDVTAQARAHFRAGTAFYEAGAYDRAISEYEEAQRLLPLPDFLFNLGRAYQRKGDARHAISYYERFLAARPTGPGSDEARDYLRELKSKVDKADIDKDDTDEPKRADQSAPVKVEPPPPPTTAPDTKVATPTVTLSSAPTKPVPIQVRSQPLYKKWWLWTAVAGAAVIVVGVSVGVTQSRPNEPSFFVHGP
jgi:tetratricopeptide (TPR) repeat protein